MKKQLIKLFLLGMWLWIFTASKAISDIAVVVSPDSPLKEATKDHIGNLFLGKASALGGEYLTPMDLPENNATRKAFYKAVTNKSQQQLNAYWSRLIFTGKGTPPQQALDAAEIIDTISADNTVIGYIPVNAVNDSVKVILILEE